MGGGERILVRIGRYVAGAMGGAAMTKNPVFVSMAEKRRYERSRPFGCKICGVGFSIEQGLIQHLREEHPLKITRDEGDDEQDI